jgi:hypothetical protein
LRDITVGRVASRISRAKRMIIGVLTGSRTGISKPVFDFIAALCYKADESADESKK